MSWTLTESFIQGYLTCIIQSILFSCFLDYRPSWNHLWKKLLIMLVPAAFIALLHNFVPHSSVGIQPIINTVISFSYQFLSCHLLFRGGVAQKILLSLIAYLLSVAAETIALVVCLPLWSQDMVYGGFSIIYYVHMVVQLLVALLAKRAIGKTELLGSTWLFAIQCIVPASTLLFMSAYSVMVSVTFSVAFHLAFTGFFTTINVFVFISFLQQQKYFKETYEKIILAADYQHREKYYRELEEHQKEVRLIRHDLKNQLLAVQDEKDMAELGAIIQELDGRGLHFTENIGLNQLLGAKMRRAEANDIRCEFNIQVPGQMRFSQVDIGALVGNIMDNAIEACLHLPDERVFRLELLYNKHTLIIRSQNSTDGTETNGQTRKPDKDNHGFGMFSIGKIVEKYNGTIAREIRGSLFVLDILLWEPK